MMAEVKGGVASYGSRIMLGLLVECSPELCAEAVERVSGGCGLRDPCRVYSWGGEDV